MVVAAPLFVLGRPLGAFAWALPPPWRRASAASSIGPAGACRGCVLTAPLAAWLVHALALWLWHIPAWFEAALAQRRRARAAARELPARRAALLVERDRPTRAPARRGDGVALHDHDPHRRPRRAADALAGGAGIRPTPSARSPSASIRSKTSSSAAWSCGSRPAPRTSPAAWPPPPAGCGDRSRSSAPRENARSMTAATPEPLSIDVAGSGAVSALLTTPPRAHAAYVLAHGAGAGMHHPFMAAVASGLATARHRDLALPVPRMERASRRPDPPRVAHATVRAAVAEANRRLGGLPLFAGGKSFGGRMTSQAQAETPLTARRRARLPRLPAAPRRPARRRTRRAPGSGRLPDAVHPGQPRRARRSRPGHRAGAPRSARARRWRCSTTPTTPSTSARAAAAATREVLERLLDTIVEWMARVVTARPH